MTLLTYYHHKARINFRGRVKGTSTALEEKEDRFYGSESCCTEKRENFGRYSKTSPGFSGFVQTGLRRIDRNIGPPGGEEDLKTTDARHAMAVLYADDLNLSN